MLADEIVAGTRCVNARSVLAPAASMVIDKAGLRCAWGFDLNSACSDFLYVLSIGSSLVESGRYKKVLVAGVDQLSAL